MSDHRFLDLADLLAPGDLLVVNNTRVRAARLNGRRADSGGAVELLLLDRLDSHRWEVLARPSRRLRPGVVIEFGPVTAVVGTPPEDGRLIAKFDVAHLEELLPDLGEIPLPPYFTGHLSSNDRYQTLFAEEPGSAAAPTAGLHFTPEVLEQLDMRGIRIAEVDLHVSLDTFRPIQTDEVDAHQMHSEWCSIPIETSSAIGGVRREGGRVMAVGTTVVRTLESRAASHGYVKPGSHRTDLFLKPGSELSVVDALITNFHMPRSTLLVLLAAFMGDRWREVYTHALERGYRFLSFGDAMFAERQT